MMGTSPESVSSTVGNIITGAAVSTIQNVVKALGGSQSQAQAASNAYLSATRPVVATVEAVAHPIIKSFNQAASAVSGAAAEAESEASKVVSSVESTVSNAAKSAESALGGVAKSAESALGGIAKSVGGWFSSMFKGW